MIDAQAYIPRLRLPLRRNGACGKRDQFQRMAFRIAKLEGADAAGRSWQDLRVPKSRSASIPGAVRRCAYARAMSRDNDRDVLEQRTPAGDIRRIGDGRPARPGSAGWPGRRAEARSARRPRRHRAGSLPTIRTPPDRIQPRPSGSPQTISIRARRCGHERLIGRGGLLRRTIGMRGRHRMGQKSSGRCCVGSESDQQKAGAEREVLQEIPEQRPALVRCSTPRSRLASRTASTAAPSRRNSRPARRRRRGRRCRSRRPAT